MIINLVIQYMINDDLVGGFNPSEKYEFFNWDDYSQYMEKSKNHVPNRQPECDIMGIWRFPEMGVPQNGWLTLQNCINIDDLGVPQF